VPVDRVALGFVLAQPFVDVALSGAATVAQLSLARRRDRARTRRRRVSRARGDARHVLGDACLATVDLSLRAHEPRTPSSPRVRLAVGREAFGELTLERFVARRLLGMCSQVIAEPDDPSPPLRRVHVDVVRPAPTERRHPFTKNILLVSGFSAQ
jgi:hypothetical protein